MTKLSERHGSSGLYTPQGAEKDYRDVISPNDQGTNVKSIDTIIVKCVV